MPPFFQPNSQNRNSWPRNRIRNWFWTWSRNLLMWLAQQVQNYSVFECKHPRNSNLLSTDSFWAKVERVPSRPRCQSKPADTWRAASPSLDAARPISKSPARAECRLVLSIAPALAVSATSFPTPSLGAKNGRQIFESGRRVRCKKFFGASPATSQ